MKIVAFFLLVLLSINISAQGIYKATDGEVSFFSATPMQDIDAHSKNISSFINTATKEVVFVIPIRNFKFKNALMEEHFNEKYLESDQYPDATFQGKINEDIDFSKEACTKVTATGKMKMHGVEKPVTYSGTLTIKGSLLNLKSDFDVALKDYNITVPKLVVESIAESIAVKVDMSYVPYKK